MTEIETVPQAIESLERALRRGARLAAAGWLAEARRLWCGRLPAAASTRVVIPVWRDPWMVVGSSTFTGDLVRRLGLANAFADSGTRSDRYPHVDLAEIDAAGADVVLLPDEPYLFTAEDGPEAFSQTPRPAGQRPAAHVVRPLAPRSTRDARPRTTARRVARRTRSQDPAIGTGRSEREASMTIVNVGVVGCGLMGAGIAEVCARAGLDVVVVESSAAAADAGRERLHRSLERAEERGKIDSAAEVLGRIRVVDDLAQLSDRDLVVEAIVEDEQAKVDLFRSSTRSSPRPTRSSPPTPRPSRS